MMEPLALFLLALIRPAAADVVSLPNDVSMSGIVSDVTGEGFTLRVAEDGYVFLSSAMVVSVELQSQRQNRRLLADWRRRRLKAESEERAQLKFAAAQRAKGLIPDKGEWVTSAERRESAPLVFQWTAFASQRRMLARHRCRPRQQSGSAARAIPLGRTSSGLLSYGSAQLPFSRTSSGLLRQDALRR
ncbi:MAG: hypothetical protein PHU21_12940 [Elusimicrobia bacterium]|nr:hypothetical protein [Elusimicrobiota bacterium]